MEIETIVEEIRTGVVLRLDNQETQLLADLLTKLVVNESAPLHGRGRMAQELWRRLNDEGYGRETSAIDIEGFLKVNREVKPNHGRWGDVSSYDFEPRTPEIV